MGCVLATLKGIPCYTLTSNLTETKKGAARLLAAPFYNQYNSGSAGENGSVNQGVMVRVPPVTPAPVPATTSFTV
ncbi:hypothetical protein GCM10027345_00160 [Hymenobacter daeguensis]